MGAWRSYHSQELYCLALSLFFVLALILVAVIMAVVLMLGLSSRHSIKARLMAALWLDACLTPVVFLVIPHLIVPSFHLNVPSFFSTNAIVSQLFSTITGCFLFWLVFGSRRELMQSSMYRDFAAIAVANFCAFYGVKIIAVMVGL